MTNDTKSSFHHHLRDASESLQQRKISAAAASLHIAESLLPGNVGSNASMHVWQGFCAVGEAYSQIMMTDESTSAFKSAVRVLPTNPVGHIRLGWELVTRAR